MAKKTKRRGIEHLGMCEICGDIGNVRSGVCYKCSNKYPLM